MLRALRKVLYILGELQDSDLQWLFDSGRTRRVAGGTTLIREGVALSELFIVVEGKLTVTKGTRELARLGAGEVVGEMSLLDSQPPSATVRTEQESLVHAIPQERLRSKLRADPGFSARFHRALCLFLVHRLARTDALVALATAPQEDPRSDELAPEMLDSVVLAGARFEWFLQRAKRAAQAT
jgi:CRP-like cAMP-binding protein